MAGDTLTAQIAESTQEIIDATKLYFPHYSPMANLVTRMNVGKGHNAVELPFVVSAPVVQNPAEGDDVPVTSQFDLSSRTITPVKRLISFRISDDAQYESRDQLITLVGETMAMTEAEDINADLHAEVANFTTTAGTTNTNLSVATLRTARRKLQSVAKTSGGPARGPLSLVLPPIPLEDLLENLGVQGVVSSTAPWIPEGFSQELLRTYVVNDDRLNLHLLGIAAYFDTTMSENASADYILPLFPKSALYLCIWWDWRMKQFREADYLGVKIVADAFYNSGVGPYPAHGCAITADGA